MSNDVGVFTAVIAVSREASFVRTQGTCHIIGKQSQKLLFCDVTARIPRFFCKMYYRILHK